MASFKLLMEKDSLKGNPLPFVKEGYFQCSVTVEEESMNEVVIVITAFHVGLHVSQPPSEHSLPYLAVQTPILAFRTKSHQHDFHIPSYMICINLPPL